MWEKPHSIICTHPTVELHRWNSLLMTWCGAGECLSKWLRVITFNSRCASLADIWSRAAFREEKKNEIHALCLFEIWQKMWQKCDRVLVHYLACKMHVHKKSIFLLEKVLYGKYGANKHTQNGAATFLRPSVQCYETLVRLAWWAFIYNKANEL